MEIQIAKLREALEALEPVGPRGKKLTLPVLAFAHLGNGRAVATDLETAVAVDLPGAQEELLLPLQETLEFLRYTPGNELARLTHHDKKVAIAVSSMEASLRSADPKDYPPLPQLEVESEGVLDGDVLVNALLAVLRCTAREDSRPVLTGICLTPGDQVEVAAGDGFRLAWETVAGRLSGEKPLIIPRMAVNVLGGLWKKGATPDLSQASDPVRVALARRLIRLSWNHDMLELHFGRVSLLTKLIQGTFPHYRQLIPTERASSVTFMAEDMDRALHQVRKPAKGSSGIVRVRWEDGVFLVSARAEEEGEVTVTVPASFTSPGRVALHIDNLLNYLKGKQDTVTLMTAPGKDSPVTFAHRGTPHIIIMPMFVKE